MSERAGLVPRDPDGPAPGDPGAGHHLTHQPQSRTSTTISSAISSRIPRKAAMPTAKPWSTPQPASMPTSQSETSFRGQSRN